jgi:hypothetical protein
MINKGYSEFFRATGVSLFKFERYRSRLIIFQKRTRRPRRLELEMKLLIYFLRKNKRKNFRDLSNEFSVSLTTTYRYFEEIREKINLIGTI